MKTIILLLSFTCLSMASFDVDVNMEEVFMKCLKNSEYDTNTIQRAVQSDDYTIIPCFMECILKELQLVSENGDFPKRALEQACDEEEKICNETGECDNFYHLQDILYCVDEATKADSANCQRAVEFQMCLDELEDYYDN